MAHKLVHPRQPCSECPWRRDVPRGHFPPERFRALANTAYDMSMVLFACHKSQEGKDATCAGFLLRGAEHNFSVRMAISNGAYSPSNVTDAGLPLYDNYRQMAVANGVRYDDPVLRLCRPWYGEEGRK